MSKNDGLIHKLYTSFPIKDWRTMQSCYHDEAVFTDPVFGQLSSKEVKAMWHMLTASAQDLKILFSEVTASDVSGACIWQAWYTFSKSGRPVHNIIKASFEFKDGKILFHQDHFNLWKWSRMALGIPGLLFGWIPLFRNQIRKNARKSLDRFIQDHPEYG